MLCRGPSWKKVLGREGLINRAAIGVVLVCLLGIACSCSSRGGADSGLPAQGTIPPTTTSVPEGGPHFELVNFTGSTLRAVYLSPSDSNGWEENILGSDELNDGNTLDIRLSPEEKAPLWDIRLVGTDGRYAEWKGLDLRGVSRITMMIKLANEPVVVAEIE
jgi:hypothetical protein